MNYEKIVILINSMAKSNHIDKIAIQSAYEHINKLIPCDLIYTKNSEHFCTLVKESSTDPKTLVAVAGGDGTLNLGLNNLNGSAPIGIIPIGTANVVAKELGIPFKIRDAFKQLLTGAIQNIDLGICNNKKFAFVAGIGFDAEVANSVSKKLKSFLGQAAYAVAILKTIINYKPARLTVKCDDGRVFEGDFAIFANMRRYGGELYFAPEARYDDGVLNMVLLKKYSPLALFKLLKYAFFKEKFPDKIAFYVEGKFFNVSASKPTMYELDGEVFGPETNFEITVNKLSQKVMTP